MVRPRQGRPTTTLRGEWTRRRKGEGMEWFQEFRECRYTKDDVVCGKRFVGVKMSKYCPDHAALAKAGIKAPELMSALAEVAAAAAAMRPAPIVTVNLYMPQEYVGAVITLCEQKRGSQINMSYHGRQVQLTYEIPMGEIVLDFFDRLKSVSRGYASMDYEFKEYRVSDVVKVDILINGDKVDALSIIVHRSNSAYRGREVAAKMREIIPRQMYDVAIQAAIGANIIARENIKALRKNVLAKCYGGDITRKRKLLEKQKAGKKRMKQIGTVEVPQEAFLAILQVDD